MRIVIDLQACQNGSRHRGIGRYAMAMTKSIIRAGRGHEFRVVINAGFPGTIGPTRADLEGTLPQEHILAFQPPGGSGSGDVANAWRTRAAEIIRARFIDSLEPDLLFVPSLFEGFWDPTVVSIEPASYPVAVTLFDLIPLDHPDVYLPSAEGRNAYLRKLRDLRKADLLLPISDYIAGEAIDRLALAPDRVVSVPLGVEAMFRPVDLVEAARSALLERHGITRPFLLNTSPFEYRKNLEGLIAGFGALDPAMREGHQLVIIGRIPEAEREKLVAMAARSGLADDAMVLTGFVSDDDLIALYGACRLFVFPSISEGFGLPVLEAMACGAPVVASSTTSIPEVVGREDLLFDPLDAEAMARTIGRVLNDPELLREVSAFGPARAAEFTWERAAETALTAFERVVAGRRETLPHARRPSIALVVATMAPGSPTESLNRALVEALDSFADVTLVCSEAHIRDPWTQATTDLLDPDRFGRTALGFDQILYRAEGITEPWFEALAESFPGGLIVVPGGGGTGAPDPLQFQRDIFAERGFAGLIAMQQGELTDDELQQIEGAARRAVATGAILVSDEPLPEAPDRWVVPVPKIWPSPEREEGLPSRYSPPPQSPRTASALQTAIAAMAKSRIHDPARALGRALPRSVRSILPDGADLGEVAAAAALNEAHDRPPCLLLDVTAFDRPGTTLGQTERAVLSAVFQHPRGRVECVAVRDNRFVVANHLVGGLIGLQPCGLRDRPLAIRAGDRLIGFDVLGGFSAPTVAPLQGASDCGAGLVYAVIGDASPGPAAEAVLTLVESLSGSAVGRSHRIDLPATGAIEAAVGSDALTVLVDKGIAVDVVFVGPRDRDPL